MTVPLLIFGYGNPGWGDDALGPLLLERLQELDLPHLELLTDFQLQVEHVIDLQGREQVLFVDASVSCSAPYTFSRLYAQKDASYTSHVMSPMALLHSYTQLYGNPPPTYLLQVRGECFELGKSLSSLAIKNLEASFNLLQRICSKPMLSNWEKFVEVHDSF